MPSKKTQVEDNEEAVDSNENDIVDGVDENDAVEVDENDAVEVDENDAVEVDDEVLSAEDELSQAQATVKEYWEQIMRLRADIENNRKRAGRDIENAHRYSLKNFTESLLPIIDSMEMGLVAANGENATLASIREGSELTLEMFIQVLKKHGLAAIDPQGEKFDPEQHQAISMIEDENAESNTVINVMQKGFSLNDRLVRPAMVVVAK